MSILLKSLRKVLWLFAFICFTETFAQQTLSTSGGTAAGSGGTISYTVGQMAYRIQTGTQATLTEGVQQPYEISEVSGIEEAANIRLKFTSYPNPVDNYLTVAVQNYPYNHLYYILYDSTGKLLIRRKATGTTTQINTKNLSPDVYFMDVIDQNQIIKKFKIIKK